MIYGPSIIEPVSPHSTYIVKMKTMLLNTRTRYQEVQIVELEEFGRALILDGFIQSTEADEYIYHESLVHPAMFTHPKPERVLIIGGGEGATLREVLKHNVVKEAVMVDIDGELIEIIKKHMGFMHQGSFDDVRTKLIISDGRKYVLEEKSKTFDVVIMDLTDPYASEISKELYSEQFFREIYRVLKEDGLVVTQAGNSFFYPKVYEDVVTNVKSSFPIVAEYWVWVPSFSYACNFIMGSKRYDPKDLSEGEINNIMLERGVRTKLYTGEFHNSVMKQSILKNEFMFKN